MDVAEVLPEFADAFPFEEFNRMQRATLPAVLDSTENLVAGAPTASGKTAIAELAICETLRDGGTALFVAPMRALTNEKEREWDRFEDLGYEVYVVTGERDLNPRQAERADILVMTPEKADSATRKHERRRYAFVNDVDLAVVDEVHLLDSERRGSVLEVVVSRLRRICDPRIVALSATMENVEEVAEWLDAPPDNTFSFGDEYRPVELHANVETYSPGENPFADKYRRLYRALDLAEPHVRDGGQALVFVSARSDTVRAAEKTRDELAERDVPVGARGDYDFHTETQALDDDRLRQSVIDGVAFHHAGLSKNDKDLVEEWFRQGAIDVLFSTSTLAWGVNLPARCVVIRDTKIHDPLEGEVDLNPLDVLQMLGRAGRPGYDDVGYAHVVAHPEEADRYRRLLDSGKPIESRLAGELDAHLNAEIAMGTVRDVDDVMDWMETTFYYVRARHAPERYDFTGLRDRVRSTLEDLVDRGFVRTAEDLRLEPTPLGRLASTYYLRLDTAERFHDLAVRAGGGTETGSTGDSGGWGDPPSDGTMLRTVARAAEFDSVSARSDERDAVDAVLGERADDLEPGSRKVLAILRSSMADSTPAELRSDAWVIRQNALRLVAALGAFLAEFAGPAAANAAARLEARVETGVSAQAVGLTAIDGVGPARAGTLAEAGIDTPADVLAAGTAGVSAAGIPDGVAERVVDRARDLPAVAVEWGSFPDRIGAGESDPREVTVRNRGGGATAGLRVTVNGREMTATETYLGDEETLPVPVFGAPDRDELTFAVEAVFPDLPLRPIREERTVRVD
ncbi:DEAD/DEAH box helicase [Halobacteriales archaeon QS_8_69_26]|nr:MAG: DEAD/DEAH box helicase [Halobacteriales archaeon QS_8_69_26]